MVGGLWGVYLSCLLELLTELLLGVPCQLHILQYAVQRKGSLDHLDFGSSVFVFFGFDLLSFQHPILCESRGEVHVSRQNLKSFDSVRPYRSCADEVLQKPVFISGLHQLVAQLLVLLVLVSSLQHLASFVHPG